MRLPTIVGVAGGLALTLCAPARAQLAGSHTLGDYGVQAGSQPGPGFYSVVFCYRYSTDTIKDAGGNTIRPLGSPPGTVATAIADYLYFVSNSTIAGAHYGFLVALPWVNGTLEAPAFRLSRGYGHALRRRTNAKVGQILTLEGGVGKSFMGGGASVGMAYYVQWKITKDQLGEFVMPGGKPIDVELPDKHRVWAVGPDITLPVASRSKLFALVNIRYLWETGARVKTQGDTLVVTATLPIPSMKLK